MHAPHAECPGIASRSRRWHEVCPPRREVESGRPALAVRRQGGPTYARRLRIISAERGSAGAQGNSRARDGPLAPAAFPKLRQHPPGEHDEVRDPEDVGVRVCFQCSAMRGSCVSRISKSMPYRSRSAVASSASREPFTWRIGFGSGGCPRQGRAEVPPEELRGQANLPALGRCFILVVVSIRRLTAVELPHVPWSGGRRGGALDAKRPSSLSTHPALAMARDLLKRVRPRVEARRNVWAISRTGHSDVP
jgi:hypothetical protein